MLIVKDDIRYYDLNLYLFDNPLESLKIVKVKSTGKLYLVVGTGQLINNYVVDYSKLTEWNLAKFRKIVLTNCEVSVDTYQEWETAFSRATESEVLNDVAPDVSVT